jgi:CheY-like chemotaxis protein
MARKPAVLVVDDEKEYANEIAEVLRETGNYEVLTAYSGKEAIKIIEEKNRGLIQPDRVKLVLLDIRMPDLTGVETLQKILRIDQNIRAIMVTAYDEDDYWIDSVFLSGAIAYILKPYERDDLLHKLEEHFKGKTNVIRSQTMEGYILDRNRKAVDPDAS